MKPYFKIVSGFVKSRDPEQKTRPAVMLFEMGGWVLMAPSSTNATRNQRIPPGTMLIPGESGAIKKMEGSLAVSIRDMEWMRVPDVDALRQIGVLDLNSDTEQTRRIYRAMEAMIREYGIPALPEM